MKMRLCHFLSGALSVLFVLVLYVPAFASAQVDYRQPASFWHWATSGWSPLDGFVSYGLGLVCPSSEDSYHHASSYFEKDIDGDGVAKFHCECRYCGAKFWAYESDLKQSYDNYVAELPAPVYGSDGSIYVLPTFSFYHLDASAVSGPVANGGIFSTDYYSWSVNLPSIRYEHLKSLYHSANTCRYGVSFEYNIPFLCSAELLFSSATYSTNAQSGQLSFVNDFAANYFGEAKNYQINSTFRAILGTSYFSMVNNRWPRLHNNKF